MSEITGIIFPIPKQFVDRLLLEKRNVFVKYVAGKGLSKLSRKQRVLFYVSKSSKEIVGEGVIDNIDFLTPDEALEQYGDKLFLNEKELKDYTLHRPNREPSKKMLVIVLSRLRRYSKPRHFKKSISMAGQYLTKMEYAELAIMRNQNAVLT